MRHGSLQTTLVTLEPDLNNATEWLERRPHSYIRVQMRDIPVLPLKILIINANANLPPRSLQLTPTNHRNFQRPCLRPIKNTYLMETARSPLGGHHILDEFIDIQDQMDLEVTLVGTSPSNIPTFTYYPQEEASKTKPDPVKPTRRTLVGNQRSRQSCHHKVHELLKG